MRGRPVDPDTRARAVELIKSGTARNAIARELGIAPSSVTVIAQSEGLTFERANETASARANRTADLKRRRLDLIDRLYAKAEDHLASLDMPFLAFNFGGKDNTYEEHTLDAPPSTDVLNLHRAASLALKDARELVRDDADEGVAEGESMLMNLILELGLNEDE